MYYSNVIFGAMKIVLFQRNVVEGYSIENVSENFINNLPRDLQIKVIKPSYLTQGLVNRIRYSCQAMRQQGDIYHILGDVHFLTYFLNRRRTILTIHDCIRLTSADLGFIRKQIYKLFWFTLPNLFCRYITTISEESKNNLISYAGIDRKRIMVINNGIDNRFRTIILTRQEKEDLLGNSEGKKTVLHISAPHSHKNVLRLIESIRNLNVKLIKVGGFNNEESQLLKKYNIDYFQFRNINLELVVKIYNAVDCLVFPSLFEGFGLPVVEAQKCGCPVVTSNTSSLSEIAGKGAVLVDPYSTDSINEGINKVLFDEELRSTVIQEGFKNAKRFEWDKIALEYYALYNKVKEEYS